MFYLKELKINGNKAWVWQVLTCFQDHQLQGTQLEMAETKAWSAYNNQL